MGATTNVGKDAEKLNHSHRFGGNEKWYYRSGKQFDSFF